MSHRMTPDLALSAGLKDTSRFPQTEEEACKVEDALARELEKLSLEEHEKIIFDLHGFSQAEEEDPEMTAFKLEQLEITLDKIPENEAYLLAKEMDIAYVRSKFLMYLRSELYDVPLTAEKIVQHFEMKRQYFGTGEVMARDIRQCDLTRKDIENLESGFIQVSPVNDSAGRPIVYMGTVYEPENLDEVAMNRAILYYGTTMIASERFQRSGMVYVFYNFKNVAEELSYMDPVYRVERSLPVRLTAGHYCYTDPKLRPFVSGIQAFIPKQDRFRFRQHLGSPNEIEFELQTYGIPTDSSPMQRDGTWSTTFHLEWLRAQRLKEEHELKLKLKEGSTVQRIAPDAQDTIEEKVVTIPERFDVLLGKSTKCREHTGNRRASHLCDMFFDKYEKANKYQKTNIAEHIVNIIRESGGRFLKWDAKRRIWLEADELVAREKIAHFFRYKRFKQQFQQGQSSDGLQDNDDQTEGALLHDDVVETPRNVVDKRITLPASRETTVDLTAPSAKRRSHS